jgi:cell division protein ZapE
MSLLEIYQQELTARNFTPDAQQEQALQALQRVYTEWLAAEKKRKSKLRKWLKKFKLVKPIKVKGIYLYGPVGAGKTWVMDIFYNALPSKKKLRFHFHRFMQYVHHEMKLLEGHPNPLKMVAKTLARHAHILFLDEFLVNDITDAMILANLLQAMFAYNITLVTTGNTAPKDLYRNGLQRQRFLPAIALIEKNTEVLDINSNQDYRLRLQKPAKTYFYPLNDRADHLMQDSFNYYMQTNGQPHEQLEIGGRAIPTIGCKHNVVWFDFEVICNAPRSQLDYLAIAHRFKTVLISNVPKISADQDNAATYFIKLVDVFYDAHIRLIISAQVPVLELYQQGRLRAEFQRTDSRLIEMQGEEYAMGVKS